MAEQDEGITSLRDTIAANIETIETPVEAKTTDAPVVETETQKAERLRDEKGRFAAGSAEVAPVEAKPAPVAPLDTPLERPSTWKKVDEWGQLPRAIQEEIRRREADYAKGVSTYKTEWESAKPMLDAMAEFRPLLQQHNIKPEALIRDYLSTHRTLALGSPQQKLQIFQQLAQQYGVPLQGLQQQGGVDPLQYINPVYERVQQLEGRLQNWQAQQEQQQQATVQTEIEKFAATHPHFEQVKETMAGLLQSNVAPDLDSAYDKAIRLHDDIWTQVQEQKAQDTAAEKLKQAQSQVARAKAKDVSPRSATGGLPNATGPKGLRDQIAENLEAVGAGRV